MQSVLVRSTLRLVLVGNRIPAFSHRGKVSKSMVGRLQQLRLNAEQELEIYSEILGIPLWLELTFFCVFSIRSILGMVHGSMDGEHE